MKRCVRRRMPKPFRGWSRPRWVRRYHRAWWALHSVEGSEFRRRHAQREKARLEASPRARRKARRAASAWRKRNAGYHRAQARRHYRLHQRKLCHFCNQPGEPGRYGRGALASVERLITFDGGRSFVRRTVLVCRRCR